MKDLINIFEKSHQVASQLTEDVLDSNSDSELISLLSKVNDHDLFLNALDAITLSDSEVLEYV